MDGVLAKKRVLIVDDSRTVREIFSRILIEQGYEVMKGEDGLHALQLLRGKECDLAIVDINMPIMGGFEFLENFRSLPRYKHTPVLVLTTEAGADQVKQGIAYGISGWIVKPFKTEHVLEMIGKYLI